MNSPLTNYSVDRTPGQADGSVLVRLFEEGRQLSWEQVLLGLQEQPTFALWYSQVLAETDLEGFLWEHPPIGVNDLTKAYEFRLYPAASMQSLPADPNTFAKYFNPSLAVHFPNLRKDADLVVPTPISGINISAYAHLAAFVSGAPQEQLVAFWRLVGERVMALISDDPLYVSTHGFGVYWLHVRLEGRPKYFRTAYKSH
ncbi:MAG: hypothetical protein AAGF89_02540 [Bacteroidota bacterium]